MKWWLLLLAACTSNPAAHETGPNCGDGVCEGDETVDSCAADCARCGDLVCSEGEDHTSCPVDCKAGCDGPIEDCGATSCGDEVCGDGETLDNCPQDCWVCGDGMCSGPETETNCAVDCTPAPPTTCGDGLCNGDETFTSCAADCAATLKLANNSSQYWYYFYAWKCGAASNTTNLLNAALAPNTVATSAGMEPGCWNFQAWNYNSTTYWNWTNINLIAGMTTTETGY
ncbi:MAG: hypothetical protein QM831_27700 [Kofleriaceae bacterium]